MQAHPRTYAESAQSHESEQHKRQIAVQLSARSQPLFEDARLQAAQLRALQAMANKSPERQQQLALQAKMAPSLDAAGVVQRAPKIVGKPSYSPGPNGCAGTSSLSVTLDGTIFGEGHNSPSGSVPGEAELLVANKMGDYRMHLVNGRLGGAGEPANLAWGTPKHNREHLRLFESFMQEDAKNLANSGRQMDISVSASYHPDDSQVPWKKYFLESLSCQYAIANGTTSLGGQPVIAKEAFSEDFDGATYDPSVPEQQEAVEYFDKEVKWDSAAHLYNSDSYGRGKRRPKNTNPGGKFVGEKESRGNPCARSYSRFYRGK